MRFLAAYIMRGRNQAIAAICGLAIASLFIPPFSLLSSALFALVILRKGGKDGLWVLLFAVLALGLGCIALTGSAVQGLAYGLLLWLPILPVAVVLRDSRSLAWAMDVALGLGLTVVVGIYALVADPAALWRERLQVFLQALAENAPEEFDAVAYGKVMDVLSHYFTGMIVGSWVLSILLGLLIARWLQSMLFNPGGFGLEFLALRLHAPVVYAGLACILAGLLLAGGSFAEFAWNLNGIFLVLFTLGGFSILHAVMGGKGLKMLIIYLALLFIPKWLLPPIALLGMSDLWVDWRKYAIKP
jgi:hypothetical protein